MSNRPETPNNGAAENCSGRQRVSRWLLPAEPAAQPARHAPPPSAVSELESLAIAIAPLPMSLKVSKIDAATRQLDTAIELWFSGGDAVSIHTLALKRACYGRLR